MIQRESDMAEPVVAWLASRGLTAYAEVPVYCRPVDIIGVDHTWKIAEAVELKLCLSHKVIRQALTAGLATDRSWAAVASKPSEKSLDRVRRMNERAGNGGPIGVVGVVRVTPEGIVPLIDPEDWDEPNPLVKANLFERLKQSAPGGDAGRPCELGIGPAQAVFDAIEKYRRQNPKASWREVFERVPNHYAHARSLQGAMRRVSEVRRWRARHGG